MWLCECDCGNEVKAELGQPASGYRKNCSRLQRKPGAERRNFRQGFAIVQTAVVALSRKKEEKEEVRTEA